MATQSPERSRPEGEKEKREDKSVASEVIKERIERGVESFDRAFEEEIMHLYPDDAEERLKNIRDGSAKIDDSNPKAIRDYRRQVYEEQFPEAWNEVKNKGSEEETKKEPENEAVEGDDERSGETMAVDEEENDETGKMVEDQVETEANAGGTTEDGDAGEAANEEKESSWFNADFLEKVEEAGANREFVDGVMEGGDLDADKAREILKNVGISTEGMDDSEVEKMYMFTSMGALTTNLIDRGVSEEEIRQRLDASDGNMMGVLVEMTKELDEAEDRTEEVVGSEPEADVVEGEKNEPEEEEMEDEPEDITKADTVVEPEEEEETADEEIETEPKVELREDNFDEEVFRKFEINDPSRLKYLADLDLSWFLENDVRMKELMAQWQGSDLSKDILARLALYRVAKERGARELGIDPKYTDEVDIFLMFDLMNKKLGGDDVSGVVNAINSGDVEEVNRRFGEWHREREAGVEEDKETELKDESKEAVDKLLENEELMLTLLGGWNPDIRNLNYLNGVDKGEWLKMLGIEPDDGVSFQAGEIERKFDDLIQKAMRKYMDERGVLNMDEAQIKFFEDLVTGRIDEIGMDIMVLKRNISEFWLSQRPLDPQKKLEALQQGETRLAEALMLLIDNLGLDDKEEIDRLIIENLSIWVFAGMDGRLKGARVEASEAMRDTLYEKYTRPEQWIALARDEFRQRQALPYPLAEVEWMKVGLETATGWEVPMFKQMRTPELSELRIKLEAEARARSGIHNAYRAYRASCQNAGELALALGFGDRKKTAPEWKVGELQMGWIETLANTEEGLGQRIGAAMAMYIEMGENDLMVREEKERLSDMKEPLIKRIKAIVEEIRGMSDGPEKDLLQDEINNLNDEINVLNRQIDVLPKNIFSDSLPPEEVLRIRSEIKKSIGGVDTDDAEELAYRLMFLFGLAAKFNYEQSPGNMERDALASLIRPNDAWQGARQANIKPPGPEAIVGLKDKPETQYFRNLTMLASFPEYVANSKKRHDSPVFVMKDGDVRRGGTLYDVLKEGGFADVNWTSITKGYGLFAWQMDQARKLNEALTNMNTEASEVSISGLQGMHDLITKSVSHYKSKDGQTVPDDNGYTSIDKRINAIKYNWLRAVIQTHDPRRGEVPPDQYWATTAIDKVLFNAEKAGFLPKADLNKLKNENWSTYDRLQWGMVLGNKKAATI